MTKEGYLDNILVKLKNNVQLDDLEISTIMSALRKHTMRLFITTNTIIQSIE